MAKGTMDPEVRVLGSLLRVLEEVPEIDRRLRICRWLSQRAEEVWPVDREKPRSQWEPWHQGLHDRDQLRLFDEHEENQASPKLERRNEREPEPEAMEPPPGRPLPPPPPRQSYAPAPAEGYAPPEQAEIQAETGLG